VSKAYESYLQFDTRIIEEALLLSIAGHAEEPRFRRGRDRIYEIQDGEEREKQFKEFHASWFQHLHLDHPLVAALQEQRSLPEKTRLCAVTAALSAQDEGADLYATPASLTGKAAERPAIAIKLRPKTLVDAAILLPFLRHELMHVADMLDPSFGYEAFLPQSGFSSSRDNLVRERYRVLWNVWIDGRLHRRGLAGPVSCDRRWTQFLDAFPSLGHAGQDAFNRLYESVVQTHHDLIELAQSWDATFEGRRDAIPRSRQCSLCRFPTFDFANVAELSPAVLHEIVADYDNWRPEEALCLQCADLYRARSSAHQST
jgi:hypothetical protein